jgi:hypothetical protein
VCTGNGIGVQIRNGDGDVVFVLGIDDGQIYFGDAYADPNIKNIVLNPPSNTTSGNRIVIDGTEYVSIQFADASGSYQLLNIRADLFDMMMEGGIMGAVAGYFVSLAVADSLPNLIGNSPDMDGDGDRDFADWSDALEQALRDLQQDAISQGDGIEAAAYDHLANQLPDMIGDFGSTADSVTGDDNQPPPSEGDGGQGGGSLPETDGGWLF